MKIRKIIGNNYRGHWEKTRTACRGIVVQDGRILLSYETKTGQWMLPGGGLEEGEEEQACCVREVAEETGVLIQPTECMLEIDEYYEEWKWINRYFFGTVIGETEIRLTDREKGVGMEPRWLPVDEIIEIFSGHAAYADTDEMRRGMYLREYTALCELTDHAEPAQLTIRRMKEQDLEPLCRLLSDPDVMQYLEPPYSREQTFRFLQAGLSDKPPVFTAESDGTFIGYVIYHAYEDDTMEIGWVLLPEYWGKGFATALTKLLIHRAAEAGKKPVIECAPGQKVTEHIAVKMGFVQAEIRDGLNVYRLP